MPFFGGQITRRRYDPGTYDTNGEWVDGAFTDSLISADVQGKVDEKDMERLPEGTRLKDVKVLYVDPSALRTVDPKQSPRVQADLVLVESELYQVMHVREHRNILRHQRAIVVRQKES